MLSSIPYGTFFNYSPRGHSEHSEKSRQVRDKVKAGKISFEKIGHYLRDPPAEVLHPFLDPSVTFVPVPKSHPMKEESLWPSLVIAQQLQRLGYGDGIETLIKRTSRIRKSATAGPGNRPTVSEHYETLAVERDLFQPDKITLIDDVLTKGSTIWACALHLHEHFPEADIQAFALVRTQGLIPDIEALVDPSTGTISYDATRDSGDRNP